MVPDSRAPLGARPLRALRLPEELTVQSDADGQPLTVQRPQWRSPRAVAALFDRWRIDDEWWRERPIARHYFKLRLEDGLILSLYHDLISEDWFEQRG